MQRIVLWGKSDLLPSTNDLFGSLRYRFSDHQKWPKSQPRHIVCHVFFVTRPTNLTEKNIREPGAGPGLADLLLCGPNKLVHVGPTA
jgi:hypothetical protein